MPSAVIKGFRPGWLAMTCKLYPRLDHNAGVMHHTDRLHYKVTVNNGLLLIVKK